MCTRSVAIASATSSDEEALGLTGGAGAAAAGAQPADNAWRWEESEDAVKAYGGWVASRDQLKMCNTV